MKKFLLASLFWGLISCNSNKSIANQSSVQDSVVTTDSVPVKKVSDTFQKNVYVWLKEDSVSFKELQENFTLTVFNNSEKPIAFTNEIHIRKFDGEMWRRINDQIVFPKMFYVLQPGGKFDLSFSPKFDGAIVFPGVYILEKPFTEAGNSQIQFATEKFNVFTPLIEGREQKVFLEVPATIKMSDLNEKISFNVVNNLKNNILFGERYEIQKFDGKQWQKIKLNFFIVDIGYSLLPGTDFGDEQKYFQLYPEQYKYSPGLYRIIKPYSIAEAYGTFKQNDTKRETMSAEFRIVP